MRHMAVTAFAFLLCAQVIFAQTRMKPTAPGTPGDPVWQGVVRLSDGRSFITDGGLALDVTLAKPAKLPEREIPGKVLEGYMNATHKNEFSLDELRAAGKTYTSPSGLSLNATYIDYLRRKLPKGSTRLRMTETMQPVPIVVDGKVVGVLMPVKQ